MVRPFNIQEELFCGNTHIQLGLFSGRIIPVISIFVLMIFSPVQSQEVDYTSLVSPFIGTDAHGHTFPGAVAPFGMVQLSPDTRLTGWDGCSGYHFTDSVIYGFSHTHLSGTGVSDYGDILLMPTNGVPNLDDYGYRSSFQKSSEQATPGYYRVYLDDPKVKVELTASQRVGMHKYRFERDGENHVVLDLAHRDPVLESSLVLESNYQISGMRRSSQWATDQVIYYWIEFSKPFLSYEWKNGSLRGEEPVDSLNGDSIKAAFQFDVERGGELLVRIGISAVDVAGARQNLEEEANYWIFERLSKETKDAWNKELGKIEVFGGTEEQMTIFYSALYHSMIAPNVWSDVDGRYRGIDGKIHQATDHQQYSVFSLWDTYRTLHPLLTIIDRKRSRDFVHSFLKMYEQGGLLPVWELAANETNCMIGYHSVSVILDAWKKGIRDFDSQQALEAMFKSAHQDHFGLDVYQKRGYIAGDMEHESVSKTLEYAYDDWCIGMFALEMGDSKTHRYFMERAQSYKHIFDPQTGFMRPRINGGWKEPFSPTEVDFHFTEANSWQYSFYVPHDISTLIGLHGGADLFEKKLDELFETEQEVSGRNQVDITGLIGQYAHGNEPSHHMAYLYNYLGKPWKTQHRVRQILDEQYSSRPDGLSGNEDCGQMSAWYVMSALGLYPVLPGSNEYVISSPIFDRAVIHLENGKEFIIEAEGAGQGYEYIVAASLNSRDHTQSVILHADLAEGGHLKYILQPVTSKKWATAPASRPSSKIAGESIVATPYSSVSEKAFSDAILVELASVEEDVDIWYRLNWGSRKGDWKMYMGDAIRIVQTCLLEAKAINKKGKESNIVSSQYYETHPKYHINLKSSYHPQYSAGGKKALIDGIRGARDWKLGGWQGFQGQDFEAVIDLGKRKRFSYVGAGFFQDIRSWIWLPISLEVYVSNDGINYSKLGVIDHKESIREEPHLQRDLILKKRARARYVKVVARNFGWIPEWHLGAGGEAYIFVDEVWVE